MIPKMNNVVEEIPEALSIHINQMVYDKKNNGERVYTFSLGEAFFDIPRFDVNDEEFKRGCHYSSSMGQPKLREKIANMYYKNYSARVNPEKEILISAGSKAIIFMILKTILDESDEVIVYEPAWLSYKEQIRLAGGVCVSIPYDKEVQDFETYITERTKAIVINNPNNPSGKLYSQEELQYLLNLARKNNIFILADEAYSDFLPDEENFVSLACADKNKENSLIVNSLSKNMGMSGWRIGYIIAHEYVIKQLLKINQHLITCAATVLEDYLAEHFDEILSITIPQAKAMATKRKAVTKLLDEIGIKYMSGVGTFYLMLDVSSYFGSTEDFVYKLLIDHNIATIPGEGYGRSTEGFIRFGIGVESLETIEKCLRIIKSYLK